MSNNPPTTTPPDHLAAPVSVGGGELYVVRGPAQAGDAGAFWTALHGLLPPRGARSGGRWPWIAAEIWGQAGQVHFGLWLPPGQVPFITGLVRAAWPGAELSPASIDPLAPLDGVAVGASRLHLRDRWLPLRTHHDRDPLTTLLASLARTATNERVALTLVVRPRADGWQALARRAADRQRHPRPPFGYEFLFGPSPTPRTPPLANQRARAIEAKADELGFDVALTVVSQAATQVAADEYLRSVAGALRLFVGHTEFSFERSRGRGRDRVLANARARAMPWRRLSLLTPTELAALWHLPTEPLAHVDAIQAPKLPPPAEVPSDGRVLGIANYPGRERAVAIAPTDVRKHALIVGATGSGKTALMTRQAVSDLADPRRALVVLDPGDGTMINTILSNVQAHRPVVVISADDPTMSVSLNPLEAVPPEQRELAVEQMLAIFRARFGASLGFRSDDVFKVGLSSILHRTDASLCLLAQLLIDPGLRRRVLGDLDERLGVGGFWKWFESLSTAHQAEITAAPSNKLRDFLVRPRLRRLLCGHSTVDLRLLLDYGGVLLVDLSPGKWGPGAAELLGSFILAQVWQAAAERAARPEDARPDVAVYLDEFQTVIAGIPGTVETALQQGRKYGLAFTLATQSLSGLPRAVRAAVLTNCRTKLVFQLGLNDARHLAAEFAPMTTETLLRLGPHEMALRVAVGGHTSATFTAHTSPPLPAPDPTRVAAIAAAALGRWARPVDVIDAQLAETLNPTPPAPAAGVVGRRPRRP